jgi:glycosyltransferase involved in cell wall biosynthesis
MALPSASVVIPCYNAEGHVERAVASAVAQTYPHLEVVCVDDGSTDGTPGVLRRLEAAHPAVRVLAGPNGGAPAARNRGLRATSGAYVQFLDADDAFDPEKVERQIALATVTSADGVVGSYRRVREDGRADTFVAAEGDAWVQLLTRRLGITSANLWRRASLERVGGWNEAWASSQEYELLFRLLQHGASVAYDAAVSTTLHERSGSISSDFDAPVRRRYAELRVQALEYLRREGLLEERDRPALEAVFNVVRQVYTADPKAARALHRRAIPKSYVPAVSGFNTGTYVAAYRLLGFGGAERMRRLLGRS